ncbi:PREDICTED: probable low affinity copper uptake protein 2 [Wasmannia auropunctata]|uniref:probable low affinity copper uptake protein 2 n=1 Tax=Wasmannia auropunctata TaxID=64793 RepID=UPI0005F048B5|nr:PREDICTED: probable low affinity copper uptake protein 2 [Wasmannia auropunctata]XP_011698473.1 PREDICTED: probable low affinity copper uptake protein 2 [Wasmannia auropunctata]
MQMVYWLGVALEGFLFPGYNITTVGGLVATCLGLAALAVLYEAMKVSQIHLQQIVVRPIPRTTSASSESSSLLSRMAPKNFRMYTRCGSCSRWTLQMLHWSFHTILGYILMMAVMTYNAYISIALVIGACIGYFIFGPTLVQLNMHTFHCKQAIVECDKNCEDTVSNEQRRESAVSIVAEQLVTEASIEVHVPRNA